MNFNKIANYKNQKFKNTNRKGRSAKMVNEEELKFATVCWFCRDYGDLSIWWEAYRPMPFSMRNQGIYTDILIRTDSGYFHAVEIEPNLYRAMDDPNHGIGINEVKNYIAHYK